MSCHRMLSAHLGAVLLLSLATQACSSEDGGSAGGNTGLDAAADVTVDGRTDGGTDARPLDAGQDHDTALDAVTEGTEGAPDVASDALSDALSDAPEPEPSVHFVGRYEQSAGVARFGWSGSGFVVRFSGTGVHVRMDDPSGFFTVVVDGAVQPALETHQGEQTYDVAGGLPDATHVVELYRRTEGAFGPTVVQEVTVDGELLPPPAVGRRIEVIGDSITCGYGDLGADQHCSFSADTEDHYQTYAALAARAIGAELSTVAWSGKGMVYNYGDDTTEPMPEIYPRTIPTEPGAWSFPWEPDAVVINLGTNDFSTDNDPSEDIFVSAYVAFLEQLRNRYPSTVVMCTVAPLLGGDDESRAVAYVKHAVEVRNAAGDYLVRWIDLRVEPTGWGCDWHPSTATHQAMADKLVVELTAALGW